MAKIKYIPPENHTNDDLGKNDISSELYDTDLDDVGYEPEIIEPEEIDEENDIFGYNK